MLKVSDALFDLGNLKFIEEVTFFLERKQLDNFFLVHKGEHSHERLGSTLFGNCSQRHVCTLSITRERRCAQSLRKNCFPNRAVYIELLFLPSLFWGLKEITRSDISPSILGVCVFVYC